MSSKSLNGSAHPNSSLPFSQRLAANRHFAVRCAVVVLALCLVVIMGWFLHQPILTSFVPGWPRMTFNTALAMLLAGLALVLASLERGHRCGRVRSIYCLASLVLAVWPVIVGGLSLAEYATGRNLGLDQLFMRDLLSPVDQHPGRPAPATALALALAGVALWVWRYPRAIGFFSSCTGAIAGLAWLAAIGLVFEVQERVGAAFFATVSLPTSLGLLGLACGLFSLRPAEGLARLITSPHHAGHLARSLVPAGLALTLALGWLRLWAHDRWHFSTELGVALYATAMLISLLVIALHNAWLVDRLGLYRRRSEQAKIRDLAAREEALQRLEESKRQLAANERRFRGIFNSTFNFIGLLAPDGTLLEANQTALDLIGAQPAEVLGRPFLETPWWTHSVVEQGKLRAGIGRAAGGEMVRFETSHQDEHGRILYVDFTLQPVFDPDRHVVHLVAEGRDITDRKTADQKSAWLATFPERNPNPVVEFDAAEGRIFYTNTTMDQVAPDLKSRGLQHPFMADLDAAKAALLSGETTEVRREVAVNGFTFAQVVIYLPEANRFRIYGWDTTLGRRALSALQASEKRYHSLLEFAPDAIVIVDPRGQMTMVNSQAEKMFGHTRGELLAMKVEALMPERFRRQHSGHRGSFFASPHPRAMGAGLELYGLRQDGTEFPIEVSLSPLETEEGRLAIGAIRDITERKQAAEALRTSMEEFRTLAEVMPQIVWVSGRGGESIYFNQQWTDYTGLTKEETMGSGWNKPFHPDDQQRAWDAWQSATTEFTTYSLECRLRRADGVYRWWLIRSQPLRDAQGNVMKWFGTCTDIHDLKLAEEQRQHAIEQIEASEELLRQFIKHTPAAIAMFDTEMRYMQTSDRWLKDYHLEGQQIIGRSHYDVFPDIPERWKDIHQRALGGAVERCDEDSFHRADGHTEWLQWEIRPWHKAGGETGGVVFYTQVITARKEAEAQMRESEERFRGAFENSAIGMALVSLEGRFIRVNLALCQIVGRTEEELLACTFHDVTHPEDLDADVAQTRALLAGEIDHYQMEKRYFHKDGHIVWILLAATIVRSTDGHPVHFVSQIEDITERREAARRVQASLEEKEVLLREIHHRVKNNMQVITSMLQLQSGYLKDPQDAAIFQDCQARIHAMALVHDRLYRSGDFATIDFSEHLRELTTLIVRGQAGVVPRIEVVVESDHVEVNLDTAIPLGLIAAELITNSFKHAFLGRTKGIITVRLGRTGEGQLTLTVEDDGIGLPAGFEPEKARSLGLRLIHALCQQLRGKLSLESPAIGSKVSIEFLT